MSDLWQLHLDYKNLYLCIYVYIERSICTYSSYNHIDMHSYTPIYIHIHLHNIYKIYKCIYCLHCSEISSRYACQSSFMFYLPRPTWPTSLPELTIVLNYFSSTSVTSYLTKLVKNAADEKLQSFYYIGHPYLPQTLISRNHHEFIH